MYVIKLALSSTLFKGVGPTFDIDFNYENLDTDVELNISSDEEVVVAYEIFPTEGKNWLIFDFKNAGYNRYIFINSISLYKISDRVVEEQYVYIDEIMDWCDMFLVDDFQEKFNFWPTFKKTQLEYTYPMKVIDSGPNEIPLIIDF